MIFYSFIHALPTRAHTIANNPSYHQTGILQQSSGGGGGGGDSGNFGKLHGKLFSSECSIQYYRLDDIFFHVHTHTHSYQANHFINIRLNCMRIFY